MSGKNDSKGEEAAFAQEAERKPGRSAGSSKSKSSLRDVSTLKGLVKGVGFAGSSNASGRASFVGFSVLLKRAAVLFCVSFLSVVQEGRSLVEKRERLPLPLRGVRAGRLVKVLMLAVCAVPVCTGISASVRVVRFALAVCAISVCAGSCAAVREERLPLPLCGVRAERLVKVLMLAVCAMPVCTGVCASVRAASGVFGVKLFHYKDRSTIFFPIF